MNEKIKQMAIAAKLEHCVSHVRLQDFAERIINECVSIVNKRKNAAIDADWLVDEAMSNAVWDIEEHFGIELQSYKVICDRTNNP
jgi:hypothetical protein